MKTTPSDAAKAVVRRNTEEVQSKGNFKVFEELFADDFVDHTPQPNMTPDKAGVRKLYGYMREAFPDFHAEIHWQLADGDRVTTYKTYYGTHEGPFLGIAPTHRKIHFETVDVMRVRNGKITDHWGVGNLLSLMQQIGGWTAPPKTNNTSRQQGATGLRRVLSVTAAIGLLLTGGTAWSQTAIPSPQAERKATMTMKDDLANRSPDIHWPEGFDPATAGLFSHNELVINAPCECAWNQIIDATKWPDWYPNSKDVRIIGGRTALAQDTVFRWTTFGLALESKINEFVPYKRIGWYGYAPGATPNFYHTWFLTQTGDTCRVVTDEVGMGKDAARLRETDESLMHRGHDLWLATLKWVSEGSASARHH